MTAETTARQPRAWASRLQAAHLAAGVLLLFSGYLSIAVSQIALGLALVLFLVRWRRGDLAFPRTGLELPALLLAGWALLTLPFSQDVAQSAVYYRRFYLFTAIWSVAPLAGDRRGRLWLAAALMAGALVISVYSQVKALLLTGSLFSGRMRDVFNPMTSGALLMMPPLVALGVLLERRLPRGVKIAFAVAALPVLLGLLQTMTRSALLGWAAGVALVLLAARPRWFAVTAGVGAALALALALGGDDLLPGLLGRRLDPGYLVSGQNTSERLEMWRGGWHMLRDHPWLGVGDHDLAELCRQYFGDDRTVYYGHLHNNLVHMAVIWGVPGLLLGTWFLVAPGRTLWRRRRAVDGTDGAVGTDGADGPDGDMAIAWALGGLGVWAAFFVAGLTEWYFGDAETMLVYLAILGAALAPRRE